jgi:hypothetical protein
MSKNSLETQFTISYELLELLRWLCEHEPERLRKVVHHALENGLQTRLDTGETDQPQQNGDELQQMIMEFFSVLEAFLYESMHTHEVEEKAASQQKISHAINQIDGTQCDANTVSMSIAKATSIIEKNENEDAKDVLCKELLKQWSPNKKRSLH